MELVSFIQNEGVARITLSRGVKRNIINYQMYEELKRLLHDIRNDSSARVLIFDSIEPGFCAGADLGNLNEVSAEEFKNFVNLEYEVFGMLERLPIPTIAVINGPAMGAGFELVLCCDFRIADERALFGFPEPKLGFLSPTHRISRIMGETKANELLFMGINLNAQEALEVGLLNRLVSSNELVSTTTNFVNRLSQMGPMGLRFTKESLILSREQGPVTSAMFEQKSSVINFISEDVKEGFAAFIEKRPPKFKGK